MGNLIVDLMVENGFLEKDIKKLNELVKELEIQNKEVAKENKNLSEQNGQLIHSYNRMKNELERANRERAKELQENSELSNVINTYESSTNSLNYKIKQLTEELNKLTSKEYINEKWGRYENTINDLKRELNEYKVREKDYQRDLEKLENYNESVKNNIKQSDYSFSENYFLKAKLNNSEKEIEKLQFKYKAQKEINKKLNKSLDYFLERSKVNDELRTKLKELLNRYIRCATEPSFYLSLEKEIQFNEHLLSTVLFLQQAKLISDSDYYYYTEKITNSLNKLKEGIDNEKR